MIFVPTPVSSENNSCIGLFFICSEASIVYSPSEKPSIAVRKRAAVPALPTLITACFLGIFPPQPKTVTAFSDSLISTINPKDTRLSRKCLESSENSTPSNFTSPSDKAAIKSARFVMLLDPGTSTVQSTGLSNLFTSYCSFIYFHPCYQFSCL